VATAFGHISTVEVTCNYGCVKQKGCAYRGCEMLAEYATA
jgi:hypothetical protein